MTNPQFHTLLTSLLFGGLLTALIGCGPVPSAEQKAAEAQAAEDSAAMRAALEQLIAMQEQSLVQGIAQQSSEATNPAPASDAGRDLAPTDTYYLTERISVATPSGVRGFEAGTKVLKVIDGLYTIDGEPTDVDPLKLTNDLNVVREIIRAQRAKWEAAREARARAMAPPAPQAAQVTEPDPFALRTIGNTPAPPIPPASNELPPDPGFDMAETASSLEDGPASPLGRPVQLDQQELEVPKPALETAVREYQSPSTGQRYQIRVTGAKVSDE